MPKKTVLRPPFCRIGSKRDIADLLISYFPDDYTIYVEPFVGSGAVYWKKKPTAKEIINDLDSKLIQDYRLLKNTADRRFRKDMDTVPEIQAFVDKTPRTDADKLAHGVVSRCNRWMGKETGDIYRPSNPYNKLRNIDAYQERMKNTKIENMSYEKVIQKYDSPTTFFFLDPPYEETKATGKLYEHGGMTFDFQKMRDVLSKVKGKWLLTINDSPNIRSIFKGFYYRPLTVFAKSMVKGTIGSKDRKELIIANYPFIKGDQRKLTGGFFGALLKAILPSVAKAVAPSIGSYIADKIVPPKQEGRGRCKKDITLEECLSVSGIE